ncbi:hypothetical protein EC957_000894, partial [Mortierella hygrophila]
TPPNSSAPITPPLPPTPPILNALSPSPLPPDATDPIFARAINTLDETCRARLLRPAAEYNAEIIRIACETKKQQTTDSAKYARDRARYRKLLVKRPLALATMMSTIDTEVANAAARIRSLSSRRKTIALGIRRRATEAINEYRQRRLVALRVDLEIRLTRKAEDSRALEARKLQQRQEGKPMFDASASFTLQERYQHQPPYVPGPLPTQIGPLCLSPTEAASMRAVQDTPVNNQTPRILYSDGSLLNSGTPEVSQAFGVVDLTQDNTLTVKGRTDGHASSAKAELMGLLTAVLSAPPEQDIV